MYILTSTDDNYCQHLCVMLVSLLENCPGDQVKEIAIINDKINRNNIEKIKSTLGKYKSPVRFIEFENNKLEQIRPKNNKTLAAFHRIFVCEFYSADIEKVLYLDCDIIIRKDISELFNTDISNYLAGAVQNDGLYYQNRLGMPEESLFFNSGVMLINLTLWRELNIEKKLINYIETNYELMLRNDQDALNAVLFNSWLSLSPKWNTHLYFFTSPHLCRYDAELLHRILKDPAVVHFTTQNKPWFYLGKHPFKKEYYKYLKLTAWNGFIPADKTPLNIFRKNSIAITGFIYRKYKRLRRAVKKLFYKLK